MTLYETPRGKARIIVLAQDWIIDLDEDLDLEIQDERAVFAQRTSNSGRVQSLLEYRQDVLRARQMAPDLERVIELQRLWRSFLAKGQPIEILRDRTRSFHFYGDLPEDEATRQRPLSGAVYTIETLAGKYRLGAAAVDPGDPVGATRTNLVPNGDFVDDTSGVPTGWTNPNPTTLYVQRSYYDFPVYDRGQVKFHYLDGGTKDAYVDFGLGGFAANTVPGGYVTVSFLMRSDRPIATAGLVDCRILKTDNTLVGTITLPAQPSGEWAPVQAAVDVSGAGAVTTLRLRFSFSVDLKAGPVEVAELQIEPRRLRTAFVPYSTVRTSLTGSRSAGVMSFTNKLQYQAQRKAWRDGSRFGYTLSMWALPHWDTHPPAYVIRAGVNDKLDFKRGVTDYTATLTAGVYDPGQMAAQVQTQMRAQDSGNAYVCSYSTSTKKFSISGTATFDLRWNTGANTLTSAGATIGYSLSADDTGGGVTGVSAYVSDTGDVGLVTLFQDHSLLSTGNVPALRLYTSIDNIYADALLVGPSGTSSVQATVASGGWTLNTPKHLIVSFQDYDGSGGTTGSLKLILNGSTTNTTTHGLRSAGFNESFTLGNAADGLAPAGMAFHNVRFDPVWLDGTTYTVASYYNATDPPDRLRNGWRAKLGGKGPAVSFLDKENCYAVALDLVEDVHTPGS